MNLLVVGRLANVTNLNLDDVESELTKILTTASKNEIAENNRTNNIDVVVVGAGLDQAERIEIVNQLLTTE